MPIIYEYLDSLLQHDPTANAKLYNQQANVNSISQTNDRRTISFQHQRLSERDVSDTETSQSIEDSDDAPISASDAEQDTRDVIVIPSGQTSDVGSRDDETSTAESDYKSCDEEKKNEVEEIPYTEEKKIKGKENIEEDRDKERELEQISGIKNIKEERMEEAKVIRLNHQTEGENRDNIEKSTKIDTKINEKVVQPKTSDQKANHDKNSSTIGNAKEKRAKVKVVIPIIERARSKKDAPKPSPTPSVDSSNETIKTKAQKKKESAIGAPTNDKAYNNVRYDLAAKSNNNAKKDSTPNNNAKNNIADAKKTAAKKLASQSNSQSSNSSGAKLTFPSAERSKTPMTPNKADVHKNNRQVKTNNKIDAAKIPKSPTFTPQKGKDKDTQSNKRRASDDEKTVDSKANLSRQSSVDTEIRYPKRKRAPDSERNLEFMAKEDAKMARRIGNHSAKRKKLPKTSPKSSQQ